jgi:hypothetical protein
MMIDTLIDNNQISFILIYWELTQILSVPRICWMILSKKVLFGICVKQIPLNFIKSSFSWIIPSSSSSSISCDEDIFILAKYSRVIDVVTFIA